MLRDYAYTFANLCKGLEVYRSQLTKIRKKFIRRTDVQFQNGVKSLELARTLCAILPDMELVFSEIKRIEQEFEQEKVSVTRLSQHFEHLSNTICDNLQPQLFLHIEPRVADFYRKSDLFGGDVGQKLPELHEDMQGAGNCLALGQPTACVFHLMRVMERSVQAFARSLKVKVNTEVDTWFQILENVNKKIQGLANRTASQRKNKSNHAELYALLNNVRIAWRNEVMHPKASYTNDEANEIFLAVQSFVRHLAKIM